ncbi:MAG: sigma-54-dependent Fis family transcriptional regulator [Deltaproteobacteria bacterium]|nr:MAG: sigma-54-dependent Fis family transcriptional regulator [Deltaproteobacteria bacterium]
MDQKHYQDLHTIVMLKDVIRKWWGLELAIADASGYVLDHAEGKIIPPNNDFCRLSLFSKEGLRRCNASVKYLGDRFRSRKKPRRCLFHDCHMDFSIVGCPIVVGGTYRGFLFVGGFLREPMTERQAAHTEERIRELNPSATDLERAVRRMPVLSAAELEKLCDLLEFAADEIANFEAEIARREERIQALTGQLEARHHFEKIIGKSAKMQEVFRLLEKVVDSDSTVLIQGESGTGKELVARAIHFSGARRDGPFVVQNCSAFNDNLLESALFGHVRGAFTGAIKDKKGLFEVADGGTFFLDEIGEMSPALQVKLLRVLQEGAFTPVGSTETREVDVRVIAATHKDLKKMVEAGEFREDLYYRINVIHVEVPPLRERRDDIPLLVTHFLTKHAREGEPPKSLDEATLALLMEYTWPGNIRELENEIERLLVLGSDRSVLGPDLLSPRIREAVGSGPGPDPLPRIRATGKLKNAIEALEREMIHQGLIRTQWNKSRLARELGISRSNLIAKCEKYGLVKPERR